MNDLDGCEVHVVYTARDLGPAAARGLAGERQAGPDAGASGASSTRPRAAEPWFMRAFDLPDRARQLVAQPAAGAGARGDRAAVAAAAPRRAVAAVLPGASASTRPGRRSTASAPTPRSASPRPSCCAGSTAASSAAPAASRRTTTCSGTCSTPGSSAAASPARCELPPDRLPWAEEQAERWIEWVKGAGAVVHGDLEDLRPARGPRRGRWRDPDQAVQQGAGPGRGRGAGRDDQRGGQPPDPRKELGARARRWTEQLRDR